MRSEKFEATKFWRSGVYFEYMSTGKNEVNEEIRR